MIISSTTNNAVQNLGPKILPSAPLLLTIHQQTKLVNADPGEAARHRTGEALPTSG